MRRLICGQPNCEQHEQERRTRVSRRRRPGTRARAIPGARRPRTRRGRRREGVWNGRVRSRGECERSAVRLAAPVTEIRIHPRSRCHSSCVLLRANRRSFTQGRSPAAAGFAGLAHSSDKCIARMARGMNELLSRHAPLPVCNGVSTLNCARAGRDSAFPAARPVRSPWLNIRCAVALAAPRGVVGVSPRARAGGGRTRGDSRSGAELRPLASSRSAQAALKVLLSRRTFDPGLTRGGKSARSAAQGRTGDCGWESNPL